jgi:hypothetical protein
MSYTADQMCKGRLHGTDGSKCILAHLQERYGKGNCKRQLQIACEIIEAKYPRPRATEGLWLASWSGRDDVGRQDMADVLNETVAAYDCERTQQG